MYFVYLCILLNSDENKVSLYLCLKDETFMQFKMFVSNDFQKIEFLRFIIGAAHLSFLL